MAWALFNGEKQISKSHDNKEVVYTEAAEKGFVLFSKGERWLQEGASIREIDTDIEVKEPIIGDATLCSNGDVGVIVTMKEGTCYVSISHAVDINELTWDKQSDSWIYP